jgi:hypothetical protein
LTKPNFPDPDGKLIDIQNFFQPIGVQLPPSSQNFPIFGDRFRIDLSDELDFTIWIGVDRIFGLRSAGFT